MNFIRIYHNSFTFYLFDKTYSIIKESFTAKVFLIIYYEFSKSFSFSFTKQIFSSESNLLNDFFSDTFLILTFKNIIFKSTQALFSFSKNFLKDSISQKAFNLIRKDLTFNFFRYASFFFVCWIMMYVILELIFGRGFTRLEMLFYILLVIFLFPLTGVSVSTDKILKNSYIIKWIENLFD